ncbi:acetylxylan esterase [Luteolibacter sp. AS25]|uniref:acetylxylan esterase n=1 Tax=Luteolibacter sp. AS25 TaxID=3135776 RepID=UPI00398B9CB6
MAAMFPLRHSYAFDPTYGYSLENLLLVDAPQAPRGFEKFWEERYSKALEIESQPEITPVKSQRRSWKVHDLSLNSTDGVKVKGWCLTPASGKVKRVLISFHGYGGREEPDFMWKVKDTAVLFPCARGLGKSLHPPISSNPLWHVLHDIQDRKNYIHGGCVEDIWLSVSAALKLFPQANGRVGLMGTSFSGGLGAMALAWDQRISRAHFAVPSFGNQPLRMKLKTTGSGAAVQAMYKREPAMVEKTLSFYDAAIAAQWIKQPVSFECAMFDPVVAPPGQFAVYNAVKSPKSLFVRRAGHFKYPEEESETRRVIRDVNNWFSKL